MSQFIASVRTLANLATVEKRQKTRSDIYRFHCVPSLQFQSQSINR